MQKNKFDVFFDEVVQPAARKQGKRFFMDTAEGVEHETDTMEAVELSGWLVPEAQAGAFRAVWMAGEPGDEWDACFVFAKWRDTGGVISVTFESA